MTGIRFGTSGWRGVLAEDFTFPNARLVTQAIADHLRAEGSAGRGVVVGYDTRFMSEAFAETAAGVMAASGIPCFLAERDTPTPVVSHAIRAGRRAGGINVTASHNPPFYNGLKFSPSSGGPAPTAVTDAIETRINAMDPDAVKSIPLPAAREKGLVVDFDPSRDYLGHVNGLIDREALRRARLKVVVDAMWGTGRGYLDAILKEHGVEVEVLHAFRDPYFGGHRPEPSGEFLHELSDRVRAGGAHLGLAMDADADRFGVVDDEGRYREANEILPLLLDYLIRTRGWPGGVARSVATTHLIDRVAAHHCRPVYETKVGFKYLGEYIQRDSVVMVGEESEGFSMKGHLPEKDGILACLLVAEMVASTGKGIPELLGDLFSTVGPCRTMRLNLSLEPSAKARLLERLQSPPPLFADRPVVGHVTLDGHKYILEDGSWVCFRPSGTEPVVRFYMEAPTEEGLAMLKTAGEKLIREI
jgi:phosphoglucomutase